jgi:hypothetical protein
MQIKKKVKKKKLKSIVSLKRSAQRLFNSHIKQRDRSDLDSFVCISCQKKYTLDKANAGHFFGTQKYNWLRFNEDNVHLQCIYCNNFNHESLIGYTLNLPLKIGQERFEHLLEESLYKKPDFSREELLEIINHYANR